MKYLVCDTNIWYGIADGSIHLDSLKDYKLVGSSINIFEFASSFMLISNLDLVRAGMKAFLEHHHIILKSNFYEHLISVFDEDFVSDTLVIDLLIQEMNNLLTLDINSIPQKNIDNTQAKINKLLDQKSEFIKDFNDQHKKEKESIDDPQKKKQYKNLDFTYSHRRGIVSLINDYSERVYNRSFNISLDDKNWSEIEFFMKTWDVFFRMVDIQKNMKLDKNDWPDLFNLVFVQPGYKYSTKERKWKHIFNQDSLLSSYFIDI